MRIDIAKYCLDNNLNETGWEQQITLMVYSLKKQDGSYDLTAPVGSNR